MQHHDPEMITEGTVVIIPFDRFKDALAIVVSIPKSSLPKPSKKIQGKSSLPNLFSYPQF